MFFTFSKLYKCYQIAQRSAYWFWKLNFNYVRICLLENSFITRNSEFHCVKSVRVRSFSDSYFPAFGLNTASKEYSAYSILMLELTRKNSEYVHCSRSVHFLLYCKPEVFLDPCQTSNMKIFAPSNIFEKNCKAWLKYFKPLFLFYTLWKHLVFWSFQRFRSSPPKLFLGKGALKVNSKFTGEHSCHSVISIKFLCIFIEITLRHGCSPLNLLYTSETSLPNSSSRGLLLEVVEREISDWNGLSGAFFSGFKSYLTIKTWEYFALPLSWQKSLSYLNQSNYLLCKSID